MFKSLTNKVLFFALLEGVTGVLGGTVYAQVSGPNEIVGVWHADNGNLKFEVFDSGGTYAARVIYGNRLVEADGKTFKKDVLNPDPSLRSRSLEGILILSNLKWNAKNRRWEGGSLYDGSAGQTYSARVSIVNAKMELRGYKGTPMLGRTVVLHRVDSPAR
jgi:uncharacterized protein (DUF2147 family)